MKLHTKFSHYTIAEIIGAGITGVFWIVLANLIDPSQYGEIQYVIGIASIGSIVATFGAGNSIIVFVSKGKSNGTIFIIISLFSGILAFTISSWVLNRLDVGFLIFSFILFQLGIAFLQGYQKYKKYLVYLISQKAAFVLLGLLFIFSDNVDLIIFGFGISYLGFLAIVVTQIKLKDINLTLIKKNLDFVISNYITSLFSMFKDNIDKIIIVPILGYTHLGNYALALQAILMLN